MSMNRQLVQRHVHAGTAPLTTLMSSEIPGMVSQRLEKVVIWVFPPDEVAMCESAYFRFTTKSPNL